MTDLTDCKELVDSEAIYERAMRFFITTIQAPSEMPPEIVAEMVSGLSHDIGYIFDRPADWVLDDLKRRLARTHEANG
jgi:hypothetical protein